jgi:hypothetical protein
VAAKSPVLRWGDSLAGLEASVVSPSSFSTLLVHGHV